MVDVAVDDVSVCVVVVGGGGGVAVGGSDVVGSDVIKGIVAVGPKLLQNNKKVDSAMQHNLNKS